MVKINARENMMAKGGQMNKFIYIQKEIEPEMILDLDKFNGNQFGPQHNSKCYLMISLKEGMCGIIAELQSINNVQNYGQYAIRVYKDKLQFFNNMNGWSYFSENTQNQFQLRKADEILLGDNDEVQDT